LESTGKRDEPEEREEHPVSKVLTIPADDAALVARAREIADAELAPRVRDFEARGEYPRDVMRTLGRAGLLGVPYPEPYGTGRFEPYVRVIEALASRWLGIAESVNVHMLASYGIATLGTPAQRERYLPGLLAGDLLASNCLSEPDVGSDLSAIATRATLQDGHYVLDGTKAWATHAGIADFYTVFCRTGGEGAKGISCLFVDGRSQGIRPAPLDKKMGLRAIPTARVAFDQVHVPVENLIGREGRAFLAAMGAMDLGRLGVAACAVGLAQAAVDYAAQYAKTRTQFGQPIIQFQGVGFMLADMATEVSAARELLLDAARRHDRGEPFSIEGAKAKLFATEAAMRITVNAVQVLGGCGYTEEHPVERWMREAKLLQIIGGTSQIQRLVISRAL
jgi:alkylation response protein AidB-like acyl-CoA dehydrogenase